MNLLRFLALALVGLFAVPAVAGTELQSAGAMGSNGIVLDSQTARILFEPVKGQPGTMMLKAATWDIIVTTDYRNSTLQHPTNPTQYIHTTSERMQESHALAAADHLMLEKVRSDDAVAIVDPLSGNYEARASNDGPFALEPVSSETLEVSHAWSSTEVPRSPLYYEYGVNHTLRAQLGGDAETSTRGDFQLYVWGIDLLVSKGGNLVHIATGYAVQDGDAASGQLPSTRHERFVHAIITVHGGVLTYDANGEDTTLYADWFQAHALGEIQFQDAQGSVPARDGEYLVAGTTAMDGGAYEWSHSEGGVGVRFLDSGHVVQGDSVSFQPAPLVERGWFLPVALAALFAFALVAAYLAPAGRGWGMVDRPGGLRGLRAAGFRRWASQADQRGHRRRAAFWAARAHRIQPDDWDAALDLAIYLAKLGRFAQALRLHRNAHDGFRLVQDPDQAGHNAYQAAKAAVHLGQTDEALEWLRLAAESEPAIVADMAKDPSFASLRSFPDYLSLCGPSRGLVAR